MSLVLSLSACLLFGASGGWGQGEAPAEAIPGDAFRPSARDRVLCDTAFRPTRDPGAPYSRSGEFREPIFIPKAVPTFDQGLQMMADQTPFDRYLFQYVRTDDGSLAFMVEAVVLRSDPRQYELSGAAAWFDRQGRPTSRGTYEDGLLQGERVYFDEAGSEIRRATYDRGKLFDKTRFADTVHGALVGRWVSAEPLPDGVATNYLYNIFGADGTMRIYSERRMESSLSETGEMRLSGTEPVELSWRYSPLSDEAGQIEFYQGNRLFGRSRVTFDDAGAFTSVITYHPQPSMIGRRYTFRKEG